VASISLDYTIDVGASRIDLNATNSYSSRYYLESNNYLQQDPYNYLNLSAT